MSRKGLPEGAGQGTEKIFKKDLEKRKKSEPRIPISTRKRKQDGTPYTKLVLDAYENNVITATQAMRYLDTSLDNINKLDLNVNDLKEQASKIYDKLSEMDIDAQGIFAKIKTVLSSIFAALSGLLQ